MQCRHRLPAQIRRTAGRLPGQVELEHVGLNHLTWERAVRVAGEDVLPRLLAEHGDALADDLRMPRPLLDRLGVVPSYYLRYYYQHDTVVRELRSKPSRAAEVAAIEQQLLGMYGDPALDEKPELLSRRGGAFYSEAAVALASSLLRHTGDTQVVNTLNRGTLPFLPDDAVIEVPATVDSTGATPLPVRPWNRCTPDWSRTSPPTSTSPWRPHCGAGTAGRPTGPVRATPSSPPSSPTPSSARPTTRTGSPTH